MDPVEIIRACATGVAEEIFAADACFHLTQAIAQRSRQLNDANLGWAFGFLQKMLAQRYTLAVAKIFEKPSARNQIWSLPAILDLLDKHKALLTVSDRDYLAETILKGTPEQNHFKDMNDQDVTEVFLREARNRLPEVAGSKHAQLFKEIRTIRDKALAHKEHVTPRPVATLPWNDYRSILATGRSLLAAIGRAYLGTIYTARAGGEEVYLLSSDAEALATGLTKLFDRAKI